MTKLLFSILFKKRFFLTALISFVVYVLIYLGAVGHLVFTFRMSEAESFFAIKILPNWQDLLFRQRSPFLFEAVGLVYLGPNIKLFLSLPNLVLAAILGSLVGINIALSYHTFQKMGLSGGRGVLSLLGTVPPIVSGAVCCVPTIVLLIGLQLTATLATAWSFFVPLSLLLLFLSLIWSLKKIQTENYRTRIL
jgi:hypothetical protein